MKLKVPIEKNFNLCECEQLCTHKMKSKDYQRGFKACLDELEQCEVLHSKEEIKSRLLEVLKIAIDEFNKGYISLEYVAEVQAKAIIFSMPLIMSVKRSET